MKVLWITNLPSPYRVKFFNELGKYCELTVLFETVSSKERDSSWADFKAENFKAVIMPGLKLGASTAFCPSVVKYLHHEYDEIVVTDFSTPTGILAIQTLKFRKIPYCIESDGGFVGDGKGIKERIKSFVLPGAKMYFSTGSSHDKYYQAYGVDDKLIVRYPFTSILSENVLEKPISEKEKLLLRNTLHMNEEIIVLAVGQFIFRKGFDLLIKSSIVLPSNYGIYIVGGEPTEEYIEMAAANARIHFVGFKLKSELEVYYKAADVFVLPTREDIWGLVINEALAYGLPVVTTSRCAAGLELIEDGKNGFLVPINDPNKLANAIVQTVKMNEKKKMSGYSLVTIRKYTIEEMAKRHIEVFEGKGKVHEI